MLFILVASSLVGLFCLLCHFRFTPQMGIVVVFLLYSIDFIISCSVMTTVIDSWLIAAVIGNSFQE
jgi:hypothetical protein